MQVYIIRACLIDCNGHKRRFFNNCFRYTSTVNCFSVKSENSVRLFQKRKSVLAETLSEREDVKCRKGWQPAVREKGNQGSKGDIGGVDGRKEVPFW